MSEHDLDHLLASPGFKERLSYIKLGRLNLLDMGLSKIRDVQDKGFKVFADAKLIEIPNEVLELAERHLKYSPWMLNIMAGSASTGILDHSDPDKIELLKRFADLCRSKGTLPCAVTVLTSKEDAVSHREFNKRTSLDQVLAYTEMLLEAGYTELVCSAREAAAIRAEERFDGMSLTTPGIVMPGSTTHDQARSATPAEAIKAGATRLVIGRALTQGDFVENFDAVVANLATAA
jgi:orotidine-5'-phosphate decarboxylase